MNINSVLKNNLVQVVKNLNHNAPDIACLLRVSREIKNTFNDENMKTVLKKILVQPNY